MDAFPTSLQPLPGGHSGETFLADAGGEQVVVRVYAGRSAARGPRAPEIDAAVLELVGPLLPVPRVLEVRPGDPSGEVPGLLVTARLPGERLDLVLPEAPRDGQRLLGLEVGRLLGRLGHMVQPRAGSFAGPDLRVAPWPREATDLPAWVESHGERLTPGLGEDGVARLAEVADRAQVLLDADRRHVLVHGDLNPKNLLADPDAQRLTGVVDWEFAHAGSPWSDLGNALRLDRHAPWVEAVLEGYAALMPAVPDDVLDRARAADLYALVDLAARPEGNPVVLAATALLREIATTGDLHAAPAS